MKKSTQYLIGAVICLLLASNFFFILTTVPRLLIRIENYILWTETYYSINPTWILSTILCVGFLAGAGTCVALGVLHLAKDTLEHLKKEQPQNAT